ncbi:MAG: D-amino-acid transaminase [Alphaproteobacteria bacterium]|nr:D-amino-acid transaminase [Alphaproteobacteria bacterium]
MSRIAFVNGAYVPFAHASVHVEDRGLQFADSIYEGIAVANGRCIDEEPHWDRLERSLRELRQAMPMDRTALSWHAQETVRRNRVRHGVAYVQITRGVARRDHPFPRADLLQTVIITARRFDPARAKASGEGGVAVKTMPDIRWGRRDIKTTALIANVLAKQAAREAGAYEAWLVDEQGFVTEGASTNAWIVDADGVLTTRALSHALLPGCTRKTVLGLAADRQMRVAERSFSVADTKAAREAFITSAGNYVTPVISIDGQPVGDGKPGPVTQALRRAYIEEFVEIDA